MKSRWTLLGSILAVLLLALAAGLTWAQGPEPPGEGVQPQDVDMQAAVSGLIPIQGRLTDASGNPLNGNYSITASIYDVSSGGTALCSDTQTVPVNNGLFTMNMRNCTTDDINGRQLYLGIRVGSDAEMSQRQPIYPVPYAFSLRPGALISATTSGTPLKVYNHGTGWGLDVYSAGHDAVHGRTGSSDHAGVAGVSWGSGIGVYGESASGVGVVAKSESGNLIEAWDASPSTLRFYVNNAGDVGQDRTAAGLAKAAVVAYCSDNASAIHRSFNTVGGTISITNGPEEGKCTIDFGFTISDRYYTVATTGYTTGPHGVSIFVGSTSLSFYRWKLDGTGEDGNIYVVVY